MSATLPPFGASPARERPHYRTHARLPLRLSVTLRSDRGDERPATTVDLHVAGARIEADEPLTPGERVTIAFSAPTLWDPLVLDARVAWCAPAPDPKRPSTHAGLAFEYASPDAALAMFELLVTLGFD